MFIKKTSNSEAVDKIHMNLDDTSMHQSAEWGMRSLQSLFPWFKIDLCMKKKVNEESC